MINMDEGGVPRGQRPAGSATRCVWPAGDRPHKAALGTQYGPEDKAPQKVGEARAQGQTPFTKELERKSGHNQREEAQSLEKTTW